MRPSRAAASTFIISNVVWDSNDSPAPTLRAAMPYLELSFELSQLDPARAEAACFDHGALSVTLGDARDVPADAGAVFEPRPDEVRLWPRTRLHALFSAELADVALIAALARALRLQPAQVRARSVADRVWEREWMQGFHAMAFGRRLWVCPRHEQVTQADAIVVRLDPGLAFGTGTHASTALCLQWLDGAALTGRRVIDYGSGSGVLAVAALKLGASRVYAFDIDPQALLATGDNAADNGVAERLQLCERETQLPRDCDVLLANILSEALLSLAPGLAALVMRGGHALLGGILHSQGPEVAARYGSWFDMERYAERDGWIALHGQRH
jgi:ribosomal protein L11 methyltransferase